MRPLGQLVEMRDLVTALIGLHETGIAAILIERNQATAREIHDALAAPPSIESLQMRLLAAVRVGALDSGPPPGRVKPVSYWLSDRGGRMLR